MAELSYVFMQTWPLIENGTLIPCLHVTHTPRWSAESARGQIVSWVRERYPRYEGVCTMCKQKTIIYASLEHAEAGGWFRPGAAT